LCALKVDKNESNKITALPTKIITGFLDVRKTLATLHLLKKILTLADAQNLSANVKPRMIFLTNK
jgi:hypothetical protein